jgi:predicted phage baseplate assembly protein
MPLQAPNLDDRTFEQIVAEARALIPRYAPRWTDHNESDPGIALIQLYAWMTEMTLYRLNQVPERNYVKFLDLLGLKLKPASPARAELTFTLNRETMARDNRSTVIIPQGAQVAATEGGDEGPLLFETEQALTALQAELKAIQSYDGASYTIETVKNGADGQWFYPLGRHARLGSALLLGFDSPLPFPETDVDLLVYIYTEDAGRTGQLCVAGTAYLPVPVTLVWEYWSGQAWHPLNVLQDETRAFSRSGHILFRGPGTRAIRDRLGAVQGEFLYWLRCRLARGTFQSVPQLETVLTNTVPAVQSVTVRDEVLGGSDGRPNQKFELASTPVIAQETIDEEGITQLVSSLRLEVEERPRLGAEPRFEEWIQVEDFFRSKPDDPHYVLDRTTGEISFGDGENGRIPVGNPDNPYGNIVARKYRFGGGKVGNVGADTITGVQTSVDYVEGVTNKRRAYGGSDEETMSEARLRAAQALKSQNRAVTSEDFEHLARETPGALIGRAHALPLTHPRYPGTTVPGAVTVVLVPKSTSSKPTPSEDTINLVCTYLNKYRLLTTEVYVVPPTYRQIDLEAQVIVRPEADLAQVKREMDERLKTFFHPTTGGKEGQGWPFGEDVVYSDIYGQILGVPGVDRVEGKIEIKLDGEIQPEYKDVEINPGELLYLADLQTRVSYRPRD